LTGTWRLNLATAPVDRVPAGPVWIDRGVAGNRARPGRPRSLGLGRVLVAKRAGL